MHTYEWEIFPIFRSNRIRVQYTVRLTRKNPLLQFFQFLVRTNVIFDININFTRCYGERNPGLKYVLFFKIIKDYSFSFEILICAIVFQNNVFFFNSKKVKMQNTDLNIGLHILLANNMKYFFSCG